MNTKWSNLQLNKLKLEIKNATEVSLNLLSNVIGDSNDETNFSRKLLLTDTKAFANNSSANIKLAKIQLSKLLEPVLKTGFPLIKNVLKP